MTTGGFTRRGLGRICAAVLMGRRFLHAAKSVPLTWATQPEGARSSAAVPCRRADRSAVHPGAAP